MTTMADKTTLEKDGLQEVRVDDDKATLKDKRWVVGYWTLTSNVFFALASILYLWLAVLDMQLERKMLEYSVQELQADPDAVWYDLGTAWISQYLAVYFIAAICFVVTGLIDLGIKLDYWYLGLFMLLAGCMGLVSAIFTPIDEWLASIFATVSAHLFLVEAAAVLYWRWRYHNADQDGSELAANTRNNVCCDWMLRMADLFFVMGALIDVTLSYVVLLDYYSVSWSIVGLVSSTLWLVTASVYVASTIRLLHNQHQHQEAPKKSDRIMNTQPTARLDTEEFDLV